MRVCHNSSCLGSYLSTEIQSQADLFYAIHFTAEARTVTSSLRIMINHGLLNILNNYFHDVTEFIRLVVRSLLQVTTG
jgi:hypothetical protein